MKSMWKRLLVLGALIVVLGGCHRFPESVLLISPEDGSTLVTEAPTFIWFSDQLADSYLIKIAAEDFTTGAVLVQDTVTDTTWQMSNDILLQIYQGTYEWAVAPLPIEDEPVWSEVWSFIVDKSLPGILISPEDGAVFSTNPPAYFWKNVESASSYVIRIVKDAFFTGDIIIEDTLMDTTYTMSQKDFEIALNADYVWSVAPLYTTGGLTWREFRSFTLDKPMPELDLDTTYFPFGLNYKWVFQRHVWGYKYTSDPEDPGSEWDYYDTVTIRVTDSLFGINGWTFYLNMAFQDGAPRHYEGDTVNIVGNWLTVFGDYKLFLDPEETDTLGYEDGIEVIYKQDTLRLTKKISGFEEPISYWDYKWTTSRIKGIGVIYQLYHDSYSGHGCGDAQNIEDDLLYFVKDQNTIWRREGS